MVQYEWDIDGMVEVADGVEWSIGGGIERDTAAGVAAAKRGLLKLGLSPTLR
jgi:hypothetical protein